MILEWEIDGQQQHFTLPANTRVTLGRGSSCNVVLSHGTVSRQHAEIFAEGPTLYVRNLSRTNGLVLEQQYQTLRLEHGQVAPLLPGARLHLGGVRVQLAKPPAALKLRCSGPCGKIVEMSSSGFCPYCGTALATADTFVG